MEQLKRMQESLINVVAQQVNGNLEQVGAKELGEAIDMIKDLSEAMYYCAITDAMNEKAEEEKYRSYGANKSYADDRMYYGGDGSRSSWGGGRAYPSYPMISESKDYREGRSPMYRRMYMEDKMTHDKNKAMQSLDAYMQELSSDLSDMIQDASPEEKQMLVQKINMLASKIK